ncbi:c-type cytochrome [Aetokthonos hydrillicola Thurmond2011]|jgi:cytochrome c6|uniref:C-type cytochrome n=1 Tax=Aetokthonos hydrillicola Thurmond2011 TaxID=2712845 RepID=A0AAP5I546_9CYAN|nr:c-type cytochrome [Aetokthonos hydrillicola]MBO3461525.1 c-type cytochrome [Aetokthonos hydrillicola CCALA 1050]MBW4584664.1 c-type cytochrome [Aetokthonos hydrillicola CCALA 1050]MDR9895207.1 c-type cytochrome [Aetokthonos hydrillicola Thurmond2011]
MYIKLKRLFTILLLTLIVLTFNPISTASAADTANGAKIFSAQCTGCHINGSNIIRRGKNLKLQALKKYGMDSVEAISLIVANGKNNMSAYKDRLTEQEILEVSTYVLKQAENRWRK